MGGQGRPYSFKEQQKIVNYIRGNRAFSLVKGNSLWKEMEPVFDGRTWQSLKEHYKKTVFPILNLKRFGLTNEEVKWFRDGFVKQPVHRREIKKECRSVASSDVHISDESDTENGNQECEGATSSAILKSSVSSDKQDDVLYDGNLEIKQESHSGVSSDVHVSHESNTENTNEECKAAMSNAIFESSDRKDDVLSDEKINTSVNFGY